MTYCTPNRAPVAGHGAPPCRRWLLDLESDVSDRQLHDKLACQPVSQPASQRSAPLLVPTPVSYPSQVTSAVKHEEDEANLASAGGSDGDGSGGGGSGSIKGDDDSHSSSASSDDGSDIDVEGAGGGGGGGMSAEDRVIKSLASYNRAPKENTSGDGVDAEPVGGGVGEGWISKRKRREKLGDRVLRALSQCQACLYDVAMLPCKVGGNQQ